MFYEHQIVNFIHAMKPSHVAIAAGLLIGVVMSFGADKAEDVVNKPVNHHEVLMAGINQMENEGAISASDAGKFKHCMEFVSMTAEDCLDSLDKKEEGFEKIRSLVDSNLPGN